MSQDIAIAGAGICGLTTALALATKGYRVTVFERDAPPPSVNADEAFFNWQRPGAAQFRHPHAFLGLMCNILYDNWPGLIDAFREAGARTVSFGEMLAPQLREGYVPVAGDEKIWILTCRRATMETVLRRYVEHVSNVSIVNACKITGIVADTANDTMKVKGLGYERDGEAGVHHADIVIDATGRTSRFPGWLASLGSVVEEEKHDAEIVYYTRHYRLRPGQEEPSRGNRSGAGDLGYLKFGVFPGDNGHFAIIICLPVGEEGLKKAVRDGERFDRICRHIPGLEPWVNGDRSEATTEPFGIADIQSVWRRFVHDGRPVATGFFAVGDAAVRTNPLYGRGCSTGILHAQILAEVISNNTDPVERALVFERLTTERIRRIFDVSLHEDRRGIERARAAMQGELLDRSGSLSGWLRLALRDAVSAASRENVDVARGAMRTFNLLENPGDFLKEWPVRLVILRFLLRGRRRNVRQRLQPGPDRAEMHRILGIPEFQVLG